MRFAAYPGVRSYTQIGKQWITLRSEPYRKGNDKSRESARIDFRVDSRDS